MGAFDYPTKPFQEQELELAIEDLLQKKSLQDEVRYLLTVALDPNIFLKGGRSHSKWCWI